MIKSLKHRILALFIGLISIIVLVFSLALYYMIEYNINIEVKRLLKNHAIYIQKNMLKNLSEVNFDEDIMLIDSEIAIEKDGNIIKQTKDFNVDDLAYFYNKNKSFFLVEEKSPTEDGLYILKISEPFIGAIYIQKKNIHSEANKIKRILFIANPILLLIIIFIFSNLINKVFISVKNVAQVAKNTSVTNFSKTIPLPDDDNEIKELVESFNEMIIRLQNGVSRLDRFNSDVSHELKTPLTVIKGEVEITMRKNRDKEYYIKSLKIINQQTEQIEEIVENLLILTKYSEENIKSTFSLCSIDALILDSLEKYEKDALKKSITIEINRMEPLEMYANSMLMRSVFNNLIDNALKYSKPNTKMTIEYFKKDYIHFIINDEGIGLSEDHMKHMFERFYRAETSRSKKIKGYGLGLSMVQNSVNLHGGTIKIKSQQGKGTHIHLRFPLT